MTWPGDNSSDIKVKMVEMEQVEVSAFIETIVVDPNRAAFTPIQSIAFSYH